jgi:hypothetical protein
LNSLKCRNILGFDETFSNKGINNFLYYLRYRYWINRKELIFLLEKTGILYGSNEENIVSNQANHDSLSLDVHNCFYNNVHSVACYL